MPPTDISIQKISSFTGLELVNQFWQLDGDAGMQRKLFVDFAKHSPDAFACFAEILARSTSKILRALAIQSLEHVPVQNHPDYKGEDLKSFLKILFAELSDSSEVIKWSAAVAVSNVIPPAILESRQLWEKGEPLDRIELSRSIRKIRDSYVKKIQYFDAGKRGVCGDIPEYEEYLDYWIYCDTCTLFTENSNSENYIPIVEHVLARLQGYGVILALGCQGQYATSQAIQESAMRQARLTYAEEHNQRDLYDHLAWYIGNSDHKESLRIYAVEVFTFTGNWKPALEKFKVLSQLLLEDSKLRDVAIKNLLSQEVELQKTLGSAAVLLRSFIDLRKYTFNEKISLKTASITQIESCIVDARNDLSLLNKKAKRGQQAATDLSNFLNCPRNYANPYLQNLQSSHSDQLRRWVDRLFKVSKELKEKTKNHQ